MPPSYSVRRGRTAAQLTCRTGTSYTPVKHTPLFLLSSLDGDIGDIDDIGDKRARFSSALINLSPLSPMC